MKLMLCECCGDIVAPGRGNHQVRWCACGRHAVWWEDATTGQLRLHDRLNSPLREKPESVYDGFPGTPRAWVIGLHNGLLTADSTSKEIVDQLLAECPDSYKFKRVGSLVIKIRPVETNDTRWCSKLPVSS